MERDFKTLGIVLKKDNVKDNDVIIRILTPDRGILEVYVDGVRKSSKAVRASVFTEGVFSLSRRTENGKITLKDVDTLSYHEEIGGSLEKTALASLFCEMIIKGKSVDAYVYSLLAAVFDNWNREKSTLWSSTSSSNTCVSKVLEEIGDIALSARVSIKMMRFLVFLCPLALRSAINVMK